MITVNTKDEYTTLCFEGENDAVSRLAKIITLYRKAGMEIQFPKEQGKRVVLSWSESPYADHVRGVSVKLVMGLSNRVLQYLVE